MSMATLSLSWSQKNSSGPRVLRTSVGPAPAFEGSRTLNMLLLSSRNALGRAKCYKTGENRFSGPFLGGGLSEALRGLRQHCDDAWGGPFRRGGLSQSFLASSRVQNPEYASPGLQKCSSGVPECRICFPWAVEMLLARQNTEKQGKKRNLF